ncbi:hypothetical protein B0H34DRAFT_671840 [Crassisporium funariophilum]|nr:hypothetical protein B0H34DRAFT_671840 [Crassisporium funariophilum]
MGVIYDWTGQPPKLQHARLVALRQLTANDIPCILWSKEAFSFVHSQILVPDELLEAAATILEEGKYKRTSTPNRNYIEFSGPRAGPHAGAYAFPRSIRLLDHDIPDPDDPYKLWPIPHHITDWTPAQKRPDFSRSTLYRLKPDPDLPRPRDILSEIQTEDWCSQTAVQEFKRHKELRDRDTNGKDGFANSESSFRKGADPYNYQQRENHNKDQFQCFLCFGPSRAPFASLLRTPVYSAASRTPFALLRLQRRETHLVVSLIHRCETALP